MIMNAYKAGVNCVMPVPRLMLVIFGLSSFWRLFSPDSISAADEAPPSGSMFSVTAEEELLLVLIPMIPAPTAAEAEATEDPISEAEVCL